MDWVLIGTILAIASICLLAGAALGYYTAASDLAAERQKARHTAWVVGYRAGFLRHPEINPYPVEDKTHA